MDGIILEEVKKNSQEVAKDGMKCLVKVTRRHNKKRKHRIHFSSRLTLSVEFFKVEVFIAPVTAHANDNLPLAIILGVRMPAHGLLWT